MMTGDHLSIHTLLTYNNAPLPSMQLYRIQLDHGSPSISVGNGQGEGLLYVITGTVDVYSGSMFLGTLGGRKSVTEPCVQCVRLPTLHETILHVNLRSFAADMLWVVDTKPLMRCGNLAPYMHCTDTVFHRVGADGYQRVVAEVPRPLGYTIDCGETLNDPGNTSSWPAHANANDLSLFAEGKTSWQEVMFFVCPKPGVIHMNGMFSGAQAVYESRQVGNGMAMTMPLGSHPITAAPDSWMWYFWAYTGNALEKRYNRFSTDLGVYEK